MFERNGKLVKSFEIVLIKFIGNMFIIFSGFFFINFQQITKNTFWVKNVI